MKNIARIMSAAVVASAALATAACGSDAAPAPAPAPETGVTVREVIPSGAARFTVTSPDIGADNTFGPDNFAAAFGCTAANKVPTIRWSGAPAAAKSFAITMFDADAPTGSGFWHWMTWDIASGAAEFKPGDAAVQGTNDAGATGYLGPCPPAGDRAHTYRITVLALDTAQLGTPASTSPAAASFSMSGHIIGAGQLTATAQRP
ncbi:YbhB/YbcL family Raf kinase inhibitor-like protein [Nocardia sp. NPDC005978]|uniref:YbhB/YbcL family Raf kinase inhibitor-like protein n=1 Tax=Nocardia sp. NPDC005978 TaxID=3156725 RepID=UPI00339ED811